MTLTYRGVKKHKLLKEAYDALENIQTALSMIEDEAHDQAIFELEVARGSIDERIKELKKEEGSYPEEANYGESRQNPRNQAREP